MSPSTSLLFPVMAPKIFMYSSLLLLLLLVSTIATTNVAFPTPQYLKIIQEAKLGALATNIPSSWIRKFHVLPKGQPVPPSSPSNRHNGGHHHHKGPNEEARVGDQVRRHHAIYYIPRRMLYVPPKGTKSPPSGC